MPGPIPAWPPYFSVVASSKSDEITSSSRFFRLFADRLAQAHTSEDTLAFYRALLGGVTVSWRAELEALGEESKHPTSPDQEIYDLTMAGMIMVAGRNDFVATAQLAAHPGFLFQPKTISQEARHRYLVVVHANVPWLEGEEEVAKQVKKIADKYYLPRDHIRWLRPPLGEESIRIGLQQVTGQMTEADPGEVMILYYAHGELSDRGWETMLHDGFLWWNTMMDAEHFKKMFVENLPPDKVSSVMLVVNSCYSGALIGE